MLRPACIDKVRAQPGENMRSPIPPSWNPFLLSVLRIVASLLFIMHGTQKLFGFPPSEMPRAELASLTGFAGLLEVIGGAFVLVGLLTRPIAFVLAGEMAYAYFSVHAPVSVWPIANRGELALLFAFIWLYFTAAGAGAWSIDSFIAVRRSKTYDTRASEVLTSREWNPPSAATTRSRTSTPFPRRPS
jgi:putative oxidoreductase